jgi:CRP-like cAMP-binding protein
MHPDEMVVGGSSDQDREGKARKILMRCALFGGNTDLVDGVLRVGERLELSLDDILIGNGRGERCLFLILTGSLGVRQNGTRIATRGAGGYVGEMALVDRETKRTATVVALDKTVVLRIGERAFTELADQHPVLWRNLAVDLVRRLADPQP